MRPTTNTLCAVLSHLALSMADFVCNKWPFLGYVQDDRPENSGPSLMCQVCVCNEGRCSSMAIGLTNDGKWVFNMACTMPWSDTVVRCEV